MERFMPELAEDKDRLIMLQQTAIEVHEGSYDSPLTPDEVENRKSIFFTNSNEIDDLEAEKKELTRTLSDKIKDIKAQQALLKREIREEASKREGVTYEIAEGDYMGKYDEFGYLIAKRRLTPEDRRKVSSRIPFGEGKSKLFIPGSKTA